MWTFRPYLGNPYKPSVAGAEWVQVYLQEEDMKVEDEVKDGLHRLGKGFLSLAVFSHETEHLWWFLNFSVH